MRFIFRLVAVAALVLSFSAIAQADTYRLFNLGSDEGYFPSGFDDLGNVEIYIDCSFGTGSCYTRYFNGVYQGFSGNSQNYAFDGGYRCDPSAELPSTAKVMYGVCNGDKFAFTGFLDFGSTSHTPSVYIGGTDFVQRVGPGGGVGVIYLNHLNDVLYADAFSENIFEAVDVETAPAPEPSSIALLGTGLLGIGAAVHRRFSAS